MKQNTKIIYITATGTDVGKTYMSGLLIKKMRELGFNCGYFKPVLSGAKFEHEKLIPEDCINVLKTANIDADANQHASYIFKTPASPHLSAEIENIKIDLDKIKIDFANISKKYEYIVIEGAGGIICPLDLTTNTLMQTDIIKSFSSDVIIIAPSELGSINSTLLTTQYLKSQNINIKGIILNNFDEKNFIHQDNKKSIEKLSNIQIITTVKNKDTQININKETLISIFKEIK
ncbi:MAG: dethiobiotin synthase [Candidatus Gastranaerophilales bacterium]